MLFFLIIFGILSFVPLVLFGVFSFKLKCKLKLIYYYLIELIIVLLITSIAQFYYYQTYDLSVFPSGDNFTFFLVIPVVGLIITSFFDAVVRWLKKEEWPSIKVIIVTLILIILFFNWYAPLGQKYYHVKRLAVVEENFATKDTESVTIDGDIMITLVESEYDKIMRSRNSNHNLYYNYFYIRNNGNKLLSGSISLTLYNKSNEIIDIKTLPEIELDAQTTQLLVFKENKINQDEWNQHSFGTKESVVDFTSTVMLGK